LFFARGNLAGLQQSIGGALEAAGEDPRPVLREAVTSYEGVIALRPGHPLPYSNLAAAHIALGRWELTHGGEPGDSFATAIRLCRKAHEVDVSYVLAYENLAGALLWTARERMARGEDARAAIGEAVAELEAGLRIRPSHPEPLGGALVVLAENELAQRRDPAAALERARRTLDDAIRLSPDDPTPLVARARADLAAARARLARGASPVPLLIAARTFAARAAAMRGADAELRTLVADTWRVQAEAATTPGARGGAVAAGLEQLAGVAPAARDGAVRAVEAALGVVGAGGGDGKAACAALAAAFAEDPTLRPSLATVAARCR
jgi:tetratricopeptide (TPR) repeat protein